MDLPRAKQKNQGKKAEQILATNLKTVMEVSSGAILFVCYTHHVSQSCSTELSDLIASEKEEDDDDDDEIRGRRSKRPKCD